MARIHSGQHLFPQASPPTPRTDNSTWRGRRHQYSHEALQEEMKRRNHDKFPRLMIALSQASASTQDTRVATGIGQGLTLGERQPLVHSLLEH